MSLNLAVPSVCPELCVTSGWRCSGVLEYAEGGSPPLFPMRDVIQGVPANPKEKSKPVQFVTSRNSKYIPMNQLVKGYLFIEQKS